MVRKIIAVPNNPQWSSFFRQEAEKLASILGAEAVSIHHIGSTAIPDIHAKPIVDILIEVADIKKVDSFNRAMIRQGYQPQGEFGIPGRRFFIKGGDANRTCHIHIFEAKNPEICRHLRFRDYMTARTEKSPNARKDGVYMGCGLRPHPIYTTFRYWWMLFQWAHDCTS